MNILQEVAQKLLLSNFTVAFTGAGISVESGIPPFRGENGLWSTYDLQILDLSYFQKNPQKSWQAIKTIFYDFFGRARPNAAHLALANLEQQGLLQAVVTQNIDNLHWEAGNQTVYEFHGNSRYLTCLHCGEQMLASTVSLRTLPPLCSHCSSLLKPDFIFFGEAIPELAAQASFAAAEKAEIILVIGTTGEVMPAAMIPHIAKRNGAEIIEINTQASTFTRSLADVFLQGKATEVMTKLLETIRELTN